MTEPVRSAESVVICHGEKRIRQAIYDTFFDHFGADKQDPDEIEAADQFCREALARLRLNDGPVSPTVKRSDGEACR